VIAYNLFGYARMHTRGDVIVYKRFAKAVMQDDSYIVRNTAVKGELPKEVFARQTERKKLFRDGEVVFTYYDIKDRRVGADGSTSSIVADQVSRVNFPGQEKLWGAEEIRIRQSALLVRENDAWVMHDFNDPAMAP